MRGHAIDKTCHLRFWIDRQSNQKDYSRRSLCYHSRLVWCAVAVIAVRAHMVVLHRRVVVWISGLAHALDHMDRFAKLYESF